MNHFTASLALVGFLVSSAVGCAARPSEDAASGDQAFSDSQGSYESAGGGLTATACEAAGGELLGDMGNGAIHRADYRCPDTGKKAVGIVRSGLEAAACCLPPAARMSASACEGLGAEIVADIGDGATHRSDYRCPGSGDPPIASIAAAPMELEGGVCCK